MASFGMPDNASSSSNGVDNKKKSPVKYEILDVFGESDYDNSEDEPICIEDDDDDVDHKTETDKVIQTTRSDTRLEPIDLTQDIVELTPEHGPLSERLPISDSGDKTLQSHATQEVKSSNLPPRVTHDDFVVQNQQTRNGFIIIPEMRQNANKNQLQEPRHRPGKFIQPSDPRWLMSPQDVEIEPRWSSIRSGDLVVAVPVEELPLDLSDRTDDGDVCIVDCDRDEEVSASDNTVSYTVVPFDEIVVDDVEIATGSSIASDLIDSDGDKTKGGPSKKTRVPDKGKRKSKSTSRAPAKPKGKSTSQANVQKNSTSALAAVEKPKRKATSVAQDKPKVRAQASQRHKDKRTSSEVQRANRRCTYKSCSQPSSKEVQDSTVKASLNDLPRCSVRLRDITSKKPQLQQHFTRRTNSDQCCIKPYKVNTANVDNRGTNCAPSLKKHVVVVECIKLRTNYTYRLRSKTRLK